jgi:hypothetical protein
MSDPRASEGRALSRISVARPYFDLADLEEVGHGIVDATVPSHPPTGAEAGAIEAAQVARHLAILGSCAVALSRDDDARHHYLATRAHYSRMANAPATVDGPMRAQAIGSWVDRRTARALVTLSTVDGRALNLLDVEYTVLAPRMFSRLNPAVDVAGVRAELADLAARGEDVESVEHLGGAVRVDAGPIPVEMCAGHFPDHPAAPVAIVMGRLCQAAGLAMIDHLGLDGHRYRIEEGHVTATGLARAGQRLVLEARYAKPVRGGHELEGRALADGEVVGQVTVVLSPHGPAVDPAATFDDDPAGTEAVDDIYRDAIVDPDDDRWGARV